MSRAACGMRRVWTCPREGFVCEEVFEVLGLEVELVDGIEAVDVASIFDRHDRRVWGERLVHDLQ